GGLEINDHFDLGRKFDWKVAHFVAFENFVYVVRRAVEAPLEIDAVADETACVGVFAVAADSGYLGRRGRLCDWPAPKNEKHIALLDNDYFDRPFCPHLKCRSNFFWRMHGRRRNLHL